MSAHLKTSVLRKKEEWKRSTSECAFQDDYLPILGAELKVSSVLPIKTGE